MLYSKEKAVKYIILMIFLICVFTTVLDFCRAFGKTQIYAVFPVEYIKRIIVLLAAALVWLAGSNSISRQDNRLMKLLFVWIVLGELLFLQGLPVPAIAFFAASQLLLIKRHSAALFLHLKKTSPAQSLMLTLTGMVLLMLLLFILLYMRRYHIAPGLFIGGAIYGIILCTSLWSGLANYSLVLFPRKNAAMVALGMLCFFCCDICVAMDGLLYRDFVWLLARSFIWIFYAPAITLLALSDYSYEK